LKKWRADVASELGEVLARVFADPHALTQGRVFVNRARVQDAAMRLPVGSVVEVGEAVAADGAALEILHVEPELVVVNKPADLASVPDHHGHDSLQARIATYCKLPLERVHPTSRLDRGVSGVVIFALAKSARDALAKAREDGAYCRLYLAIAERAPQPAEGEWNAAIGRDARDPRKRAVRGKEATHALTLYRTVATAAGGTLLALRPQTGRTHQLRVHAAHAGSPLDGDGTYGGRTRIVSERGDILTLTRIALHAARVELPWKGRPMVFRAPVPDALTTLWATLGGAPDPWDGGGP
jgi:RluA family pseudouridine synthase